MNVADDCRSELLVGGRRGRLSDAGRLALDAHLAACASCRMAREVSADFDARRRRRSPRRRPHSCARRSRAGPMETAGSRGACGAAPGERRRVCARSRLPRRWSSSAARRAPPSGGCAGRRGSARPCAVRDARGRAGSSPAARGNRRRCLSRARPRRPAPEAPLAARPRPVLHAAAETRAGYPTTPAPSASATSLLQQATEARQRDERARAAELYRRLQHEFPASAEAVLSAVPLGGLLLDGRPAARGAGRVRWLSRQGARGLADPGGALRSRASARTARRSRGGASHLDASLHRLPRQRLRVARTASARRDRVSGARSGRGGARAARPSRSHRAPERRRRAGRADRSRRSRRLRRRRQLAAGDRDRGRWEPRRLRAPARAARSPALRAGRRDLVARRKPSTPATSSPRRPARRSAAGSTSASGGARASTSRPDRASGFWCATSSCRAISTRSIARPGGGD